MNEQNNPSDLNNLDSSKKLTRRDFLKYSTEMIIGGVLLTSCMNNSQNQDKNKYLPNPNKIIDTTTTVPETTTTMIEYDPALTEWTYDFANIPNGPLPTDFWNFDIGTKVANYNNEAQAYTNNLKNIRVEDGILIIEAIKENYDGKHFTSARINTFKKFSFLYGTLETDMILPQGIGTWPAAWLLPRYDIYNPKNYNVNQHNKFIYTFNGEIDFMETIGRLVNENYPAAHTYASLNSPGEGIPILKSVPDAYTKFHKYGVIKTPDLISFTLDGEVYATVKKNGNSPINWPFDQPYYLIINLALGGNWAGGDPRFPPYGIDESKAPWQLKTRSIHYTPL